MSKPTLPRSRQTSTRSRGPRPTCSWSVRHSRSSGPRASRHRAAAPRRCAASSPRCGQASSGARGRAAAFASAEAKHMAAVEEALAAEEARRAADADRHTWVARADALAQALDNARARAGAARLSEIDGVVGTLLEIIEIDEGYEPAFE